MSLSPSAHQISAATSISDSNSITIPKSIDLKIKTPTRDHEAISTNSTSTPSIATSMSSSVSPSASSPAISTSNVLQLDDDAPLSPLCLSQRSSPNSMTFNAKTKRNKRSNSVNDVDFLSDEAHEDTRSASQPPRALRNPSFSISTFLINEIECIDIATTPINDETPANKDTQTTFSFKNEMSNKKMMADLVGKQGTNSAEDRIYNFFWLFFIMEKLLFFGFWICCDSFLLLITILPTRVLFRMYMKCSHFMRNEWILFYDLFVRYYVFYAYNTFKYDIVSPIICTLYSIIQKVLFCQKSTSIIDKESYNIMEDNDQNKRDEYQTYFDDDCNCGFCCKLLCILSCCCVFNRSTYYNKQYEDEMGSTQCLSTKQEAKSKNIQEAKWLMHLKQHTYNKRMAFLQQNGTGYKYTGRDYLDIIRLCTLILCVYILAQFNLSQIYHYIRAQENFKLYVLFKIIVIIEHLASSFGEDCIEALFNSLNANTFSGNRIMINLMCYVVYNVIHSLLLYGHLITLNAAMNSPNNTLITILVADNFYELKSTVFRKYAVPTVFQITCSDIVERFTVFLFVLLILFQNLCYLGWDNFDAQQWFIDALKLFLIMLGFEMVVDTVKHGFICKFNNLSINIYKSFYIRLSMDFTNARRMNEMELISDNKLFFMDRRLGFASLPLVTLFLRIMWQLSEYNNNHFYVKATFIIILFIILYVFKLTLSLIMIATSVKKMKKKDLTEQYTMAQNLSNVRRYALLRKKIPV